MGMTITPTAIVTPFNPAALHLTDLIDGQIVVTNPDLLTLFWQGGRVRAFLRGSDFTYDTNGQWLSGTVTNLEWDRPEVLISVGSVQGGFSTQIVRQWILTDNTLALVTNFLAGPDVIRDGQEPALLHGYDGNDTIFAGAGYDTIFGDEGDDIIYGANLGVEAVWERQDDQGNYMRGDNGDDVIHGGASFDDINGNRGNDTLYGRNGNDWVVGGQDEDLLYGDNGNDIVYGNLGADTVYGGDGDDWVRGGQGDDLVDGGAGIDWLWGDRGNDTVTGGAGADVFHSFSGAGVDRITDFKYAEGDRIVLDDRTPFAITQMGGDAVITLGGTDQVILVGVSASTLAADAVVYA